MPTVLVLEDQEENFRLIKHALDGCYNLRWATTLEDAKKLAAENFDAALVDIVLPDGDGFQFCYWLRAQDRFASKAVLFLTAQNTSESRITGFTVGADDYISRPFNPTELKTRLDSKIKRFGRGAATYLEASGIRLDLKGQRAFIESQGNTSEVELTAIEFKILSMLVTDPNKVIHRDEMLNHVWGDGVYVYPRSVDTHISKLRRKLGPMAQSIESVHGVGYKLTDTSLN